MTTRRRVTADTITDEQIRELKSRSSDHETRELCDLALRPTDRGANQVYGERYIENTRKARARCATKINAQDSPDIFADLFAAPLTVDTVRDENIRTLLHHDDSEVRGCARLALGAMNEHRRRFARVRCAEILNARKRILSFSGVSGKLTDDNTIEQHGDEDC